MGFGDVDDKPINLLSSFRYLSAERKKLKKNVMGGISSEHVILKLTEHETLVVVLKVSLVIKKGP